MMGWLKRRAYLNKTLGIIQAMTLMLGNEGKLLARHSGVREAILHNFCNGKSRSCCRHARHRCLLGDSIDKNDDTARKQIVAQTGETARLFGLSAPWVYPIEAHRFQGSLTGAG